MTSPKRENPAARLRAAGFVIFRILPSGAFEYLLLRHGRGGHWSLPKGHLEAEESELAGALRETREETGLSGSEFETVPEYRKRIVYRYALDADAATQRGIPVGDGTPIELEKTVTFFLGRQTAGEIRLSSEHTAFAWVSMEDAMKLLVHHDLRSVLTAADVLLCRRHS